MTPPSKRKRGSSVSFSTNKGADEIQISLAPYIQTYLAHTGHGLGCCGIGLPVPFERAAPRSWWNPRFDSKILEDQYRRSAFPQIRLRFRYALIYILLVSLTWLIYFVANGVENNTDSWPALAAGFGTIGVLVSAVIYLTHTEYYKRCVLPLSLGVALMLCLLSLLFVALIPPHADGLTLVGHFAVCSEILLLIYTVLPMPLYACLCICGTYSLLFEFLTAYLYGAYTVDRYTDHLHGAGAATTNTENQLPSLLSKGNASVGNFLSNNTDTHSRMESLDFTTTLTARILMQICIHIIGIHILIMTFVRMRGTFMKVGQSLLVRRQLEMEKQLKEKMIHSVMPPKVADWLMEESEREREREDSLKKGSIPSNHTDIRSLFRPFNMHSMEDVSILFADIVGFTKMSSNKTAEELVDILNDLFERFDDLCELNGCEKISTLGDCYYCVSGCPEPRPDHATCCIEMGLAMIEAIKQFDIERREGVNMRVGVHTGTVLCGIVGTKRFKFDVWSNDVTLANKLESTGKPGKVHLSEKTLSFLGDRYLTEEGDTINGVRSYFIRARKSDIMNQFMVKVTSPTSISPLMQTRHRLASCDNQSVKPKNRYFHMLSIANNYRTKANSLPSILDSENDGNNIEVDKETQDDSDSNKSPTSTASYGKKKIRPGKPWRYLQRQRTTEEIRGFDDNENKSNGRNTDIVCISQRDECNVIGKDTLGNGVRVDLNPDPTALPSSPLLPSPAVTMRQPISHASSICSRKDSGIRSNSRRSSIQQQLFLMNEMAQGGGGGGGGTDLLGHRVSGYYTSSSTLNSTHEPSSSVPPYPFPPIVTDTFGACFHKLRKQSDLQLIRCVQDNVASQRSYFVNPPLSSVTLFFKNKEMEKEYRENAHKASEGFGGNPPTLATSRFNTYFDILVSALVYTGITVSLFLLCQPAAHYVVFCAFATGIQAIAVFLCIRQLLDPNRNHGSTVTQRIFKFCSRWYPWHVCGALLVGLPIISILLNFSCNETRAEVLERHHYYHYYCSYLVFVGLVHFCNFTQLNCWMKNLLVTISGGLFVGLFRHRHRHATEIYLDVVLLLLLVWFLNREFEISYRLSFHGNAVAARDKARVQSMKNQADWLLHNIIPKYVADQLKTTAKYSQNHKSVGIIFASIVNFNELYDESYLGGKEYLRVLNELIADFDELLEKPEYANVEKIKTIGSSFMAASGLNPSVRQQSEHKCTHLFQLMDFALAMQKVIFDFNRDLLGFKLILRVGYNYGDVTAGVIGATKLYYDIWGDAVNIASRMDSTGVPGRIQFASNCVDVLSERYKYEPRGQVYVKGKDNMNVFLIAGKKEGTELPFRPPGIGESPPTQSPR